MSKRNGKVLSSSNALKFETLLKGMESGKEPTLPAAEDNLVKGQADVKTMELFTHGGMRKSLIIMFINWIIVTMSEFFAFKNPYAKRQYLYAIGTVVGCFFAHKNTSSNSKIMNWLAKIRSLTTQQVTMPCQ